MPDTKYTTVTPVLSTKAGYLEDVRDQIATVLRYIIMNPGRTSSLWEDQLVSFRKLAAQYEDNRDEFVNHLKRRVDAVFTRMFKDIQIDINFSTSNYDEKSDDGRYTVSFDLFLRSKEIGDGAPYEPALITGEITVDEKHNDIRLHYERNEDTNTI